MVVGKGAGEFIVRWVILPPAGPSDFSLKRKNLSPQARWTRAWGEEGCTTIE